MCGRFTLTVADVTEVADSLQAAVDPSVETLHFPRFNAAPGQSHLVLAGVPTRERSGDDSDETAGQQRLLRAAFWGFEADAGGRKRFLINARSETAWRSPAFRGAFAESRCCLIVDGFYEWARDDSRQPFWFHPPGGGLWLLAGLFQKKSAGIAFTVLTREANADVGRIHHRMPLIVDPDGVDTWLGLADDVASPTPKRLQELLTSWADVAMDAVPVSPKVGDAKFEDPSCIEPGHSVRQGSLF